MLESISIDFSRGIQSGIKAMKSMILMDLG